MFRVKDTTKNKEVFFGEGMDPRIKWPSKEIEKYFCLTSPEGTYIYDPEKKWEHHINLEDVCQPDYDINYPICAAGERACPLEECDGIDGYNNLLEALAEPKKPKNKSILKRAPPDFDPETFDPNAFDVQTCQLNQEDSLNDDDEEEESEIPQEDIFKGLMRMLFPGEFKGSQGDQMLHELMGHFEAYCIREDLKEKLQEEAKQQIKELVKPAKGSKKGKKGAVQEVAAEEESKIIKLRF